MFSKKNVFIFALVLLIIFTRFYKFDWGEGFFFHPDENNMAMSISQMTFADFNPRFFAYGQFPLFLSFFSLKILFLPNNFSNAIFSLRFWSAIFSCLSILFFYFISNQFFKKKFFSLIFVLFLIFNPGLIQLAHFGTTESLLILIFSINLFLSLKFYKHPKFKYIFYAGLVSGIGLATKITAVFFTVPVFLSLFFVFLKNKKFFIFLSTIYFLIFTICFAFIFSPFNFLVFSDFRSSMQYETSVALGNLKVFYTNQFLNTISYSFQFTKIFPYILGIPVLLFGIIGFCFFVFKYRTQKDKQKWLLVIIPCLIYFIYNGQLYSKWTRFMSPLFFIFPFFAVYFLTFLKNKKILYFLISISIIPGILFFNLYFHQDIRLVASKWIESNIPENSRIISETGNVINFPITSKKYFIDNLDFYNLDNDPVLKEQLFYHIFNADYIIIPSRRVFKNNFLATQNYYKNLFSGKLGFQEIKSFSTKTDLFLNSENAEETWTVFDNPTVRIFKKIKILNVEEIKNILN